VKTGEWVVAMGNPFGLGGTVTAGIVSAEGRNIGDGPYDSFLQVDAAINKGNSGGPLFDQLGHVIGVNTAIISPSGGSVGIGFAIPSDMVKTVVAQLEKSGHVVRGYLGVAAQPVAGAMAEALHLPTKAGKAHGALIASVEPNSPAEHAGLLPGDVIEKVGGQTITDPRVLAIDVAGLKPGAQTTVDVIRGGKPKSLTVTLASLPDKIARVQSGPSGMAHHGGIGLALAPLTPQMRSQLSLPDSTHGVVVAQVMPNSAAAAAGVQPGDLLLDVGAMPVTSPGQAANAIHTAINSGNRVLALRILHNGQSAYVAITVGKGAKAG